MTTKQGVYRHYKGELYLVLFVAHNSDEESDPIVVYMPLYIMPGSPGWAARKLSVFTSSVNVKGKGRVPRYKYLGPVSSFEPAFPPIAPESTETEAERMRRIENSSAQATDERG